jgi:hypothetical protein
MRLTLEAATVIRVPPPGRAQSYALAVARTDQGLLCGGLLTSDERLPAPGTALVEAAAVDGVRMFTTTQGDDDVAHHRPRT